MAQLLSVDMPASKPFLRGNTAYLVHALTLLVGLLVGGALVTPAIIG